MTRECCISKVTQQPLLAFDSTPSHAQLPLNQLIKRKGSFLRRTVVIETGLLNTGLTNQTEYLAGNELEMHGGKTYRQELLLDAGVVAATSNTSPPSAFATAHAQYRQVNKHRPVRTSACSWPCSACFTGSPNSCPVQENKREAKNVWKAFKEDPLLPLSTYWNAYAMPGMGLFLEGYVVSSRSVSEPLGTAAP